MHYDTLVSQFRFKLLSGELLLFLFIIFTVSLIIFLNLDGRINAVVIRKKVIATVRAGLVSVAHSSTVHLNNHRLM